MSAQDIATAFQDHLASYDMSVTLGAQVPYGQKLMVTSTVHPIQTRTLIIYDGKKGPRIVFEGSAWPEELRTYVQTLWNRFQQTSTDSHESAALPTDGRVIMYVDGSYQDATGKPCISWAFEVWQDETSLHAASGVISDEHLLSLRNVAGECEAARQGLRWCHNHALRTVEVRFDFQGVSAWPTGSWKAKLPFTQQYAQAIREMMSAMSISWTHVRGHSGEVGNERVDQMARTAIHQCTA